MKSYGICPASCGEFVQGISEERRIFMFLCYRFILNSC